MIRPEAAQTLKRWSDAMIGGALFCLGLWWAIGFGGVLQWLGVLVVLAGGGIALTGIQRARFLSGRGGAAAGLIELDEAQLAWFGPEGGVVVPHDLVTRIDITHDNSRALWRFTMEGGTMADIPANAIGHEKLFDALAHYPGARYEAAISASNASEQSSPIWVRKNTDAIPSLNKPMS